MFDSWFKKQGERWAPKVIQQPECPHDDWTVYGYIRLGHGICTRCKREMELPILLRAWKDRLEREVRDATR